MKIIATLRGTCPDTETCPAVHLSDRSTLVVQGYTVVGLEHAHVPAGHGAVEIPLSLVPELAARPGGAGVWLTDRNTVIMTGAEVVDADALEDLRLPAGESAIEVQLSLLPEIEVG